MRQAALSHVFYIFMLIHDLHLERYIEFDLHMFASNYEFVLTENNCHGGTEQCSFGLLYCQLQMCRELTEEVTFFGLCMGYYLNANFMAP
jgi:hypothetical protein